MGLVAAWGIAFFLALIFACGTHLDDGWLSFTSLTAKCVNTFDLLALSAITDVSMDVMILALPHFWVSPVKRSLL